MSDQAKSGTGKSAEPNDMFGESGLATKRPKAMIDIEAKDVTPTKPESALDAGKKDDNAATDRPRTKPKLKAAKDVLTGQSPIGSSGASAEGSEKTPAKKPSKTKTPPDGPKTPSNNSGAQAFSHILAGIAGGLVALFSAAYGLNWATTGGPFSELDRARIERRIAVVEKSVETASAKDAKKSEKALEAVQAELDVAKAQLLDMNRDLSTLRTRADKLEANFVNRHAGGESDVAKAQDAQITKLEKKVAVLEEGLSQALNRPENMLNASPKNVGGDAALMASLEASFDEKINLLRQELAGNAAAPAADLERATLSRVELDALKEELASRTSDLQRKLAKIRDVASQAEYDLGAQKSRTQLLNEDLKTLRSTTAKLNASLGDLKGQLTRLGEIASDVDGLAKRVAPLGGRITALEGSVSGVLARESDAQADARKTALAVALANLKRVIDRGEAYRNELDIVEKLAPTQLTFEKLKSYSATGVQTATALERSFAMTARRALDADAAPKDNSIMSTLLANARSVVRVRRTGEVAGDGAEAIIARMELRVKEGNLAAALKEGAALNGLAREAADPWLSQVAARLTVNEAMQKIETDVIAALGGGELVAPESEKQ